MQSDSACCCAIGGFRHGLQAAMLGKRLRACSGVGLMKGAYMSDSFKLDFKYPESARFGRSGHLRRQGSDAGAEGVRVIGGGCGDYRPCGEGQSASRVSSRPRSSSPHRQVLSADRLVGGRARQGRGRRGFRLAGPWCDDRCCNSRARCAAAGRVPRLAMPVTGRSADLALGARLRSYRFDHYKSKKKKE